MIESLPIVVCSNTGMHYLPPFFFKFAIRNILQLISVLSEFCWTLIYWASDWDGGSLANWAAGGSAAPILPPGFYSQSPPSLLLTSQSAHDPERVPDFRSQLLMGVG